MGASELKGRDRRKPVVFQGYVEKGMVILHQPLPLPDGTPVLVEPAIKAADFWRSYSLDELASQQGVRVLHSPDDLLGGWPVDEVNDNFEEAVFVWRGQELEHRR
jgi:hypothetical protein